MHDDFWIAIGRLVPNPIDPGGRRSVRDQLDVAFQAGWEPVRLARWLAEQVTAARRLSNPAGYVIARLREIPAPADVPKSQRDLDEERAAAQRVQAAEQAAAIATCTMCDDRGWDKKNLCDHDREAAERNAQGSAKVRDALAALAGRHESVGSGQPGEPHSDQRPRRATP